MSGQPDYNIFVPPPNAERLDVRCAGCKKPVNLGVFTEAREFFQGLVRQGVPIPPNMVITSYQCGHCRRFTIITALGMRMIPDP